MSNALYPKGKERILNAGINWAADTIKAALVDAGTYTPNMATDEFLGDIPLAARVFISDALQNKTSTNGVADADDLTLMGANGVSVEYLVIFKDSGDPATSPLIGIFDSATGLPVTPQGNNLIVRWSNGAYKIFAL